MTTQLDLLQRDWCDSAMNGLTWLLLPGQDFTADDLHDKLTPPAHPNWWGVLMAKLCSSGRYKPTGEWRKSSRKSANGRKVPVWRVVA